MIRLSVRIHKDQLGKLFFAEADKTNHPDSSLSSIKMMLKVAINQTTHSKKLSTIVFQTRNRGILQVKSSILMAGKDFIVLKGGQSLPIKSIVQVIP